MSNLTEAMLALLVWIEQVENRKLMDVLSKSSDVTDFVGRFCPTEKDFVNSSVHDLVAKFVHVLYKLKCIGRFEYAPLVGRTEQDGRIKRDLIASLDWDYRL